MNVTLIEEREGNLASINIYSKLIENRIIFINDDITDELSGEVIAQLLYLDSLKNKVINIYINTPGGSIFAGLSIYDISKYIKSPIRTVALGSACSMGAILLLMGQERCALKHTRIMFHQPSGGAFGTSDDIKVTHELIETLKANLYKIVEENTLLKNVEQIFKLDTWYNSKQALDNGIITKIL